MVAEGLKPWVWPKVQWAIALDDFGREVFLRGGSKAFEDGFRVSLVGFLDEAEGADDERVAGCLADVIAFGVPVVDNVKVIAFWIGKQFVEVVSDDHIEIEEEDAFACEAGERVITETRFFAVIVAIELLGDHEARFGMDFDLWTYAFGRFIAE